MSLTPFDPQWVGAWWIGILAGMGGFLLVLLPIVGYPKRLPGKKLSQDEPVSFNCVLTGRAKIGAE